MQPRHPLTTNAIRKVVDSQVNLLNSPKWFKDLLAWNFSFFIGQELPECKFESSKTLIYNLFKGIDRVRIRSAIRTNKRPHRKIRIMWDLLQSKSVAETVPKAFILDALQKHRDAMKKLPSYPGDEILEEIREFIQPWLDEVMYQYDGFTKIPNRHSNYQTTRKDGGNRGYFLRSNRLRSRIDMKFYRERRMDPVMIHITGPPGFGKSTICRRLCHQIQEAFGIFVKDKDSYGPEVYSRSAYTDHWDGYKQQLITIIDDFGFEGMASINQNIRDSSIGEIIQLCSDVDYVCPMADLRDKGMKFTSKFLILTSNRVMEDLTSYSGNFGSISEPMAIIRRIMPYFSMHKKFSDNFELHKLPHYSTVSEFNRVKSNKSDLGQFYGNPLTIIPNLKLKDVVNFALSSYRTKFETLYHEKDWIQPISHGIGANLSLYASGEPPEGIPTVRTAVVQDPLKARIITTPEAETYCLKPCQIAMFKALQKWRCFEPCFGPDYNLDYLTRIFHTDPEKYSFLSGDYTAATDNLNYHCSQVCMEELAKRFDLIEPLMAKWIRYEGQKHLVQYPKTSGIPDVVQENGQLMGSLLSFPILTILNAFTICKASGKPLDEMPGLIHGDDVAACMTESQIESWKSIAKLIGLDLSVGKNYVSKEFISIDSQVFVYENKSLNKQKSGKFKLIRRSKDDSFTARKALENGFTKDQVRRYCGEQLSQTTRSLDIPEEFGGLGISEEKPDRPLTSHEKIVYLATYNLKSQVKRVSGDIYMVEKGTQAALGLSKFSHSDIEEDDSEISFEKDLRAQCTRLHRLMRKNQGYAEFIKNLDIFQLRSLKSITRIPVHCGGFSRESLVEFQNARLGIYIPHRRCDSSKIRDRISFPKRIYDNVCTEGKKISPKMLKHNTSKSISPLVQQEDGKRNFRIRSNKTVVNRCLGSILNFIS